MTKNKTLNAQGYQPPTSQGPAKRAASDDQKGGVIRSAKPDIDSQEQAFIWWRSQLLLMVVAFGLLLLGAGLFTLLMPPGSTQSQTEQSIDEPQAISANSEPTSTNQADESGGTPWQEQQRAEARAQSQSILSELVSLKRSLQERKVQEWAQADFVHGLELAEQGDDLYALQEYPQALAKYKQALSALETIDAKIPSVLKAYVSAANQGIAQSRFELARQKFQKALALDPNHIPALAGLARLEVLPEVLSKLASAETNVLQYNETQDPSYLERAIEAYQSAIAADTLASSAQDKLESAELQLVEHRFNAAMTAALKALLESKYATAQTQFSAALQEHPEHVLAQQGLEQALALNKGNSISWMFDQARRSQARENWQQAQSIYQAILQRDPSQASARSGLVQARVHAELDLALREYLENPMHVTDRARRPQIDKTLSQAKGISRQGRLLDSQINQLEALMEGAEKALIVTLTSDAATTVFLLKRGAKPIKYSPFVSKQLSLLPGRYALSGQRVGYQDVRQELLILPNAKDELNVDIRSETALESGGGE